MGRDVFIIGWDGSGKPFGIHTPPGELRVDDHNFGGVHRMADSFAHFLSNAITDATGNAYHALQRTARLSRWLLRRLRPPSQRASLRHR